VITIDVNDGHPFHVFQQLKDLPSGRNRAHADFSAADLDGETGRLLSLGASIVSKVDEPKLRFTTFTDPEGNKFDIAAE